MLPGQRAWWELPNQIKLMVGGYRSGKTYIGVKRSLLLSRRNLNMPGMAVSPSFPMAKKTIIPAFKETMDRAGISYTFTGAGSEDGMAFHIHDWDGVIWIGSGEKPGSLKGSTLAWAWMDEPFIQKREVFDQMLTRVSHPNAVANDLLLTGTPEELNWGYEIATNPPEGLDIGMVFARTADNQHLPDGYVDQLAANWSEEQQKAFLEGQFVNLTAGRMYPEFDRSRHVVHMDVPDGIPVVAGIDFNVDYLTAEIAYKGPTWLHFFDEIRMRNATTHDLAEELHRRYPGVAVYPDPTGIARHTSSRNSDHEILRNRGFTVRSKRPGEPRIKNRVNAVQKLMRGNKDGPNLTIEPGGAGHLVKDFDQVVWRAGKEDQITDPERSHASVGAGYMIDYEYPIQTQYVGMVSR